MPPASRGSVLSFQVRRTVGRQRSNRDSNRRTSPSAPEPTSRDTVRKSPSQRRLWNGNTGCPRTALSAASDRASAADAATGLSSTTGRPEVSAVLASGTCCRFGAATTTRSYPSGALQRRSASSSTSASGYRSRTAFWRSGFPVTTAASRIPGTDEMSGAWNTEPPVPYPIRATRRSIPR